MKKILTILLTIIPIFAYSQADIAKREIKVDSLRARVTNLWIHGQTVFDHSIKINTDTAATIKALRDSVNVLKDSINSINGRLLGGGITTLNQTFTIGNAFTLNCGDIKVIASRTNSSFGVYSPDDNIYYQYDDLTTTHTFNGFLNFNSSANFAVLPTYNSHGLFNQTYSIADSFALQTGTLRLVLDDHRSRFSLWDNGSEQFYYDEPSAKFKFNCTLDDLNASNITASGDISYNVRHGLMHISGASYTPNVTQNIPFKLTPGMTNYETPVGMTLAGDTAICVTPGAYNFSIGMTLSGANAVDWEIAAFVNSVQYTDYFTVTTTGATNFITASWFWYIDLVANDKVSFKIINISDSSDPTIKNMKIDYIKLHN